MLKDNFNSTISLKASCYELYALGVVPCLLFILSVPGNLVLIWTILKNKSLRTTINYLITSLAVCNLFGTFTQLPFYSVNAFSCKFIFNHSVCILMAFSLLFTAFMNNYILSIVCIERYFVICKPSPGQRKSLKVNNLLIRILICVIMGSFWSLTPMFGWSEYFYEGVGMSCGINTGFKNANFLSHAICAAFCIYFVPIIIFVYTGKEIIKTVKESSSNFKNDITYKKKLNKESHLVKVTFSLIAAFFLSYTPTVICTIVSIVKGTDLSSIDPMLLSITVLFARLSLVWPSYLYMFMNKDIRAYLFKTKRVHQATIHE